MEIGITDNNVKFYSNPKEVIAIRKGYKKETEIYWITKGIYVSCGELLQNKTPIIVWKN